MQAVQTLRVITFYSFRRTVFFSKETPPLFTKSPHSLLDVSVHVAVIGLRMAISASPRRDIVLLCFLSCTLSVSMSLNETHFCHFIQNKLSASQKWSQDIANSEAVRLYPVFVSLLTVNFACQKDRIYGLN